MNKAVFFDRDGIVNFEIGDYIRHVKDFKVLDSFISFLQIIKQEAYLAIIITNQAGIAKGLYSHQDFTAMHTVLDQELSQHHLSVDAVYYCPHHDDYGKCLCRKPGSLMVEKAIARFNIDPKASFMIGDKQRDKQCAEGAGVKGFVVDPNPDLATFMQIFNSFRHEQH